MLKSLLFLIIFTISLGPANSETHHLSEKFLFEMAAKGAPRLDEIEAAFLNIQTSEGEVNEDFAPELFGRGYYSETNEKAFVIFQPVFSPVSLAELGVRQKFSNGISTTASVSSNQRSSSATLFSGPFRDTTVTTLNFTMQLDVWKNLFGRLSKARVEYAELQSRNAELQKEIQTKVFSISLRRIYWSLVANKESMKISEGLLKTALQQVLDARLRFKNAVADADEVARYEAQVSSRESSVQYLKYQRENFLAQLRNLLPQLKRSEIVLDDYDLPATMNEVLACTAKIATIQNVPYDNTKYDEMLFILRNMYQNRKTYNSRYANADVQLYGTVKATGVSNDLVASGTYRGSYGGSFDDITTTNRSGYEVGMMFTMPLGSVKENVQKTKELYDEKRLTATIDATESRIINTHAQLVRSIELLQEVIKSKQHTSDHLGKRLAGMKKKYQLARVSVNDLIMDQDELFNAELTTVVTQLEILNTLFDYLVIFTDTPCAFNRNRL